MIGRTSWSLLGESPSVTTEHVYDISETGLACFANRRFVRCIVSLWLPYCSVQLENAHFTILLLLSSRKYGV